MSFVAVTAVGRSFGSERPQAYTSAKDACVPLLLRWIVALEVPPADV